jgi:hypothetical protein
MENESKDDDSESSDDTAEIASRLESIFGPPNVGLNNTSTSNADENQEQESPNPATPARTTGVPEEAPFQANGQQMTTPTPASVQATLTGIPNVGRNNTLASNADESRNPATPAGTSGVSEEPPFQANGLQTTTPASVQATPTTVVQATPTTVENPRKRSSPNTTARGSAAKQKKKNSLKRRKGARIKITRSKLFHILDDDAQRDKLRNFGASRNYYGTIVSGDSKKGYNVKFDDLPAENQLVLVLRNKLVSVVAPGEEEKEFDHTSTVADDCAEITNKKCGPQQAAANDFCGLSNDVIARKAIYKMQHGKEDNEFLSWRILKDGENLEWETIELHDDVEYLKDIDIDDDTNLNAIFFDHFFPSLKGHAKTIDKFHASKNSPMNKTVTDDKIIFHDEDADDPDWMVKQGYTLMIAAVTEVQNGTENLWKRGRSGGRHHYPNFGQYMPLNWFKAFVSAAPYCWCDEKHWYVDRRDRLWDIFLPCLDRFNERRRSLIKTVLLLLDESMSGWRPKTSKFGGLPNYTFEPRKPVPLGTMFRNGVDCFTGCIVYQDVVQNPETQSRKKYYREVSSLPGGPLLTAPVSEVLRQVEGAGVKQNGWVGGDAWFGSVMTCVEVWKRFQVHSTFIVKGNINFFPVRALHAILKARFGERPAGHSVVMETVVSGVKVFAMAYAWSHRGVSYIVSTCGDTSTHEEKYMSAYEDDWGRIQYKMLDRPRIAHFLYEYLPLIDEHNKQRQNLLNLERKWCTKDCWFRLLTTLVGMSVVDMHRWYRNKGQGRMARDGSYELVVHEFSDILCGCLEDQKRSQASQKLASAIAVQQGIGKLERIRNDEGAIARAPSPSQRKKGRATGTSYTASCYMCRKYLSADKETVYKLTSFRCTICKMPLCKKDRSDGSVGRYISCLDEHLRSDDQDLGCHGHYYNTIVFPESKQVDVNPRRSARTRVAG